MKHGKYHPRIFWGFAEPFSLLNEQVGSLRSHFGFRRSVPFHVHQCMHVHHLKRDLLLTKRGRCRQRRDLLQCSCKVLCCLQQCKTLERSVSRSSPPFDSGLGETRLCEVVRQQLWFSRNGCVELTQQNLRDATMQSLTTALEKILLGSVLHEPVFKTVV